MSPLWITVCLIPNTFIASFYAFVWYFHYRNVPPEQCELYQNSRKDNQYPCTKNAKDLTTTIATHKFKLKLKHLTEKSCFYGIIDIQGGLISLLNEIKLLKLEYYQHNI